MTILSKPSPISLSGNLTRFRISTPGQISFILKQGSETLLTQTYDPDPTGIITIDVHDIIHSRLTFTLRDSADIYTQEHIAGTFTAIIENQEIQFKVIRAGIDNFADTPENFLKSNFLTWQPQTKYVTYHTPEFLTYYSIDNTRIKLKAYFTGSGGRTQTTTINLADLNAGTTYTIPLQYAVVAGKFADKLPGAYDVWVEDTNGNRLTYIQRYISSGMLSEQEQWILFENSLGGIDTFRAYGSTEFTGEHTHNIAEIDEISSEYRVDTERLHNKNTGYLDKNQRTWLLDFFPSLGKYIYITNSIRKIVLTESNVQYDNKELPSNYTFTYKYADFRPLLNLTRTDTLPADITVQTPDLGSFTIPPRLIDFPRLPVSEGALFPVQNPYSEDWGTTTAGALAEFVKIRLGDNYQGGGGIGHTHNNIDLLEVLTYIEGYLKVLNQKISAGYADQAGTSHLLQTENFVNSMTTGKGAAIDKNGNAQVESIEVRTYLKVMELIYNRLNALEGDYSFTDFATIDQVEQIDILTYQLKLRKRWDTDFIALQEHDVVYGMINDLATDGTYYTSWMRIIQKDAQSNSIIVVLYPDDQTPAGKNHPPTASMNITRRGSALTPEEGNNNRQNSWHMSSNDGAITFLQGVNQPQLEPENYAAIFGLLPKLDLFKNLNIDYNYPYIYARGIIAQNFYEVDYNGKIKPNLVYRGIWDQQTATSEEPYRNLKTEIHTVYHLGCKWQCLTDKTIQSPKWNSTDWLFLEGNEEYTLDFESTNGYNFFFGKVDTTIIARIKFGNIDITDTLIKLPGTQINWFRDTGNIPSDNAWIPTHDQDKNTLKLSADDMGPDFLQRRTTKFTCTTYIPVGEQYITLSEEIGFNI